MVNLLIVTQGCKMTKEKLKQPLHYRCFQNDQEIRPPGISEELANAIQLLIERLRGDEFQMNQDG